MVATMAEVCIREAADTVRREGRRKTTVDAGRAWNFEKKEGKKRNGLMGPIRKKRK